MNVYLTTSGGGSTGDVLWNFCVWCCLFERKQRNAGIFDRICPPHPASTIECDDDVNIFVLCIDSFDSIFAIDGGFRIVDWLYNCTRFSIGFIKSSSFNLSLLNLDGNGDDGLVNSFLCIGISSVVEYILVRSGFNRSLTTDDGGGGNDKWSSDVSNDDNDEFDFLVFTSW